jgi:hypothetical protein
MTWRVALAFRRCNDSAAPAMVGRLSQLFLVALPVCLPVVGVIPGFPLAEVQGSLEIAPGFCCSVHTPRRLNPPSKGRFKRL